MEKNNKILVRLTEVLLTLFFFLFLICIYFFPNMLNVISLSFKSSQIFLMATGVITIFILSREKLSILWRIFCMIMSVIIIIESYFMSNIT
jgi:hypothetical protein